MIVETGPVMATTIVFALEEEDREAVENEDVCCYTCGKTPCEWLEYGVEVLDAIKKRFDCSDAKSNRYVVEIGLEKEIILISLQKTMWNYNDNKNNYKLVKVLLIFLCFLSFMLSFFLCSFAHLLAFILIIALGNKDSLSVGSNM